MPTLSQTTLETKIILKWLGIIFGGILIVTIIFNIYKGLNPTPPPPPQVLFGKLDKISFPQSSTDKKLTYAIDTISGKLPAFPNQVKVYKMEKNKPNLLSLEQAQSKVSKIGFNVKPVPLSPSFYEWTDEAFSKRIVMNIITFNFNLSSFFVFDSKFASIEAPLSPEVAETVAKSFLSSMELLPADIDPLKTKTNSFSIKNNSLTTATSLSNTQVVRVDFWQKDLDGLPIFYPNANLSTMNVLVAGEKSDPQIVEANYFRQALLNESSTYPIKTVDLALDNLKKGMGYIASFSGTGKVSIKNVSLGFYEDAKDQNFLSPVFVFEGDNNFTAYEPAITDEWVSK